MLTIVSLFFALFVLTAGKAAGQVSVREYARTLVLKRWHSEAEWRAFDAIIRRESGWNPCAYYPGRRDCGYQGSNSCGLAQRNPCPPWMRGRLWETRYAQVRDAIDYILGRYGSPVAALAFRRANGYY